MYEQEFENQFPNNTKIRIDLRKLALVHEMRIMAQIMKGWSDRSLAVFSNGLIVTSNSIKPMFREHIMKTYKKFDTLKLDLTRLSSNVADPTFHIVDDPISYKTIVDL